MNKVFKIFFTTKKRRKIKTKRIDVNYLKNKEVARKIVMSRLEYFNTFYNYKYNKIVIRNQKTRWGSCSRKGNLNFNYKIVSLPPKTADYIIIHELCHIGEFNHSKRFWDLVTKTMPDYKEVRGSLRKKIQIGVKPLSGEDLN